VYGAVLALTAVGCGAQARHASRVAAPSGPLYSERASAAVADALLAAVPIPPDTQPLSAPPRLVAGKLGRPLNIGGAKTVDRHAYWSSTERPQALLAFIARNGPLHKSEYSDYGGINGRTEEWDEAYGAPLRTPLAGPRELFVAVALDGPGHYAIRVDAAVTWHRRRPSLSLVPPTARWLQITVSTPAYRAMNPGEPSHPHASTSSVITSAAGSVRAAARAVNELPLAEPSGASPSCPAMSYANTVDAPRFRLIFRRSAHSGELARVIGVSGFVCEQGGSDTAKVTTPAYPHGLQLTDHLNGVEVPRGSGLSEHIEAAFHHRLHLVPEG